MQQTQEPLSPVTQFVGTAAYAGLDILKSINKEGTAAYAGLDILKSINKEGTAAY